MSYIVISVKNHGEMEHIEWKYLTRESVEGVPQKKKDAKKPTDLKSSSPSSNNRDNRHITASDKSIINMALHSLTLINREGTIREIERSASTWIEAIRFICDLYGKHRESQRIIYCRE